MTINITYRRTTRLSMRVVKNGDISISAPFHVSKQDIEKFIAANSLWINNARKRQSERENARRSFFGQLQLDTRAQRTEAKSRLNEIIIPLVEKYSLLMGVSPKEICYRATISQWGSCNVKTKRICFSTYLLLLPEWCIEHIVVHELAHLIVPGHSALFYEIMDRYYPRWKEARKETANVVKKCKG